MFYNGLAAAQFRRQFGILSVFSLLLPGVGSAEDLLEPSIQLAQFGGGGGGIGGGGIGGGGSGDGGIGGLSGSMTDSTRAITSSTPVGGLAADGVQSLERLITKDSAIAMPTDIGELGPMLEDILGGVEVTSDYIEYVNNYDLLTHLAIDLPEPIWQGPTLIDPNAHCGPTAVCSGTGAGPIAPPGGTGTGGYKNSNSQGVTKVAGLGFQTSSGDSGSPASRANRFSFPTTVALQYESGRVKCSGTLVSDSKIVTAAHCACESAPLNAFFGETLAKERVVLPGLRTSVPLRSNVEFYDDGFCEAYRSDEQQALQNKVDLAIVELDESLPSALRQSILPVDPIIGLNTASAEPGHLYVVGFGESDNRWWPGSKSYAEIDFDSRPCTVQDEAQSGCKAKLEIMAGRPPADTCYADSGGGLYVQETSGGQMILVGVTSRGISDQVQCGTGGIYTDLNNLDVQTWLSGMLQ